MNKLSRALQAGAAGAVATNVTHEIVRRILPNAPRVDLLGMQALAKIYRAGGSAPATGRTLYVQTLLGDLASNAAYFALSAFGGRHSVVAGVLLGAVAGVGAFALPPQMDLDEKPTGRTTQTKLWTVALYTIGGLVAGALYSEPEDDS